jgi:transposase InsO family protein
MIALAQRSQLVALVDQAVLAGARQAPACQTLSLSVRTIQRWRRRPQDGDGRPARMQRPKHGLSALERQRLLTLANGEEFGLLAPSQIVPRLADRGQYVASESTFYRVLRAANQLRHRSPQRPVRPQRKPRALSASQPNRLYSWDITYLPKPVKGQYFYLYMFLDLFSRKIVGWQVYEDESSLLASGIMRDICQRENIAPHQVVLHSDNGSPMKGATMLATLQALGVAPSFSRPAVSNDNPYSEALFKTLKYRPQYPLQPFENVAAARAWVATFVRWYNQEHRHSAISFVTPAQRHAGLDEALLRQRTQVYEAAKARYPERWSGAVRNWQRKSLVHLNPEKPAQEKESQKETPSAIKYVA